MFERTRHDPPIKHVGGFYDGASANGWHVMIRTDRHLPDAGHAAHPGFENCEIPEHYELESLSGPHASWGEAMNDLARRIKR